MRRPDARQRVVRVGIVAAILRARKTGRGQFVDVGMVDAILSMCERIVHQRSFHRRRARPGGQPSSLALPVRACSRPATATSRSPPTPTRTSHPVPPDRPAGDGHRPAALHRSRTAAPTRRDRRRVSAFTAERTKLSFWPISAAGSRSRRSTTCATSSPAASFAARDMVVAVPHPRPSTATSKGPASPSRSARRPAACAIAPPSWASTPMSI